MQSPSHMHPPLTLTLSLTFKSVYVQSLLSIKTCLILKLCSNTWHQLESARMCCMEMGLIWAEGVAIFCRLGGVGRSWSVASSLYLFLHGGFSALRLVESVAQPSIKHKHPLRPLLFLLLYPVYQIHICSPSQKADHELHGCWMSLLCSLPDGVVKSVSCKAVRQMCEKPSASQVLDGQTLWPFLQRALACKHSWASSCLCIHIWCFYTEALP